MPSSGGPRVLLWLPCAPDAPRGNATTAQRLAEGLAGRGWAVTCVRAGDADPGPADVAVALHAAHAGPAARAWAEEHGAPWVLLFTGTDLNGRPGAGARAAVAGAAACVTLGRAARRRARELFPGARGRIETIVQGVRALPQDPGGHAWPPGAPPLAAGDELVVCPSGVRAVKDPLRLVHALDEVAARRPRLRLWIAGPQRDAAYGDRLRRALAERPWAAWLGALEPGALAAVLRRARVVVSTSRSEGGPPNALLEAARLGRPLLASAIPAHREFPGPQRCFRNDDQLRALLELTLDDPAAAEREARKLQEEVRARHNPQDEAIAWDRLLRRVLRGERAAPGPGA